jgi:hypothetical protein
MQWRVRFEIMGGHVHCRLFCAPAANETAAKCGEFVVRKGAEFVSLMQSFQGAAFIGDNPARGCVEASNEAD